MNPYDALVVISFGGPERREDVLPFLQTVTRGRNVPIERLEEVAEHYYHFDGKSPINEQNRALIAALQVDFAAHGLDLPIFFGNRNWHPTLDEALVDMKERGIRRALAFITSAYSSYSGCRQYRQALVDAQARVEGAPEVVPLRRFFNHPDFVEACIDRVRTAAQQLAPGPAPRLIFTAHSIPMGSARTCDYAQQLSSNAELIAASLDNSGWDLVWQSRSGPPQVPWLEPDILDHLKTLRERGCDRVVIAPIGFLSDHMEVAFDLDVEARQACDSLGFEMARAGTVGTHPAFVRCIRELVLEQTEGLPPRATGPLPARPALCAENCCPAPRRRPA